MSTIVIEPDKTTERPPEKAKPEPKPPGKWNVVLYNEGVRVINCQICILTEIFNKNYNEAIDHAVSAAEDGSNVVLTAPKEVVEARTSAAENLRMEKILTCGGWRLQRIRFSAEPA